MKLRTLKFLGLGIEYSIYAFIFFIPISIAIVSIFACIALALFLIKQAISPDFSSAGSHRVFFLLFLLFFICMALSMINSGPFMAKGLKALFLKWGRFILIIWMILGTLKDNKRIVKAAFVFFFSSVLVGLTTFSQKFLGLEFLRHKAPYSTGGDITGPFANQVDFATYLVCLIPIVLCFSLWKWKHWWIKIGFLLVFTMLMLSSWWSHCRGGWLGLMAGLIFVALVVNYHRFRKATFLVLCGTSYALFLPLTAIGLFFMVKDPQRIVLYHAAWGMIKAHPYLGRGLGTFMDYCAQYTNNALVAYAHNCFLQIWAESGIFSLLSFLLLNGYVLYQSVKAILKMPKTLDFYILIGLSAGYIGILVHCFFDTQLYSFQASFLFWVMMGLTVASSSIWDTIHGENGL